MGYRVPNAYRVADVQRGVKHPRYRCIDIAVTSISSNRAWLPS
jgi:hypothetical protein